MTARLHSLRERWGFKQSELERGATEDEDYQKKSFRRPAFRQRAAGLKPWRL